MDDGGEQRGFRAMPGHSRARVWLWLLLIVVGGLTALYIHLHPYFRQRAAVRAIRAAGGEVELRGDVCANFLQSSWQWFVESIFGDRFLWRIYEAKIKTDESMQALRGINSLVVVWLDGQGISDRALDCLDLCPQIEGIAIQDTCITLDGLDRLKPLQKLRAMLLNGGNVNDQWLERLANNGVFQQLSSLQLTGCGIGDDSLRALQMSPVLEDLLLINTGVTDAGLKHIKEKSKIYNLDLEGTLITDGGLEILVDMKGLKNLNVSNTKVMREGVEKFCKTRPDCNVYSGYPDEPAAETLNLR
jgi:hypothetical protein